MRFLTGKRMGRYATLVLGLMGRDMYHGTEPVLEDAMRPMGFVSRCPEHVPWERPIGLNMRLNPSQGTSHDIPYGA